MSSAAGIPTGWQVVQDLIRKVATLEGVDTETLGDAPEAWWEGQGRGEPRYSALIEALGQNDAARQALLRQYFDPPPAGGMAMQPTAGHDALARLCAAGRVRVIVTMNFDRLIERALDRTGISPQVIATPQALDGMTPLPHSPVTVIKLNGDYLTLGMRNTAEELSEYPEPLRALVTRVVDDYGLLVVGWSGEYDTALVGAIEGCVSKRYPMYWASYHGQLTEQARRLIANRQAALIDTTGADELLSDLVQRTDLLEQRAVRRQKPQPLRIYSEPFRAGSPPQGWACLPLLILRGVAIVGPASIDSCGFIRPQDREAVTQALDEARISRDLDDLAQIAVGRVPAQVPRAPHTDSPWQATPGGHQSTDYAFYRWGGDASQGVSALVTINLPSVAQGGSITVIIDIGVSPGRPLKLGDVAALWRDSLVLTSAALPEAFVGVLPVEADVFQVELHAHAPETDGQGNHQANKLLDRVNLSSLGEPTRRIGPSLGFAAAINGALSEQTAGEVVVEAVETTALAWGYLDPRAGVERLRNELGFLPRDE